MKEKNDASLPYIHSLGSFLLTIAINVVAVLLAFWGKPISQRDFLFSMASCGAGTAIINVLGASGRIRKLRLAGRLPARVPQPMAIRLLPRNKWLLALVLAVIFGVLAPLANWLLATFYEVTRFTLVRHTVWQAAFSCALTVVVMQVAVLRLVQPDCALPDDPEQTGGEAVVDPLPRFSALKNWFNTVADDFGVNMLMGLLFGSTCVVEHNVVIAPTTRAGIVISALILGLAVALQMAFPVTKSVYELCASGQVPAYEKPNPLAAHMPSKPFAFAMALIVPIMLLSLLVFWAVLSFFGFDTLNFFQFFVIRTIYVAGLSKLVVKLAIWRFRQPAAQGKQPDAELSSPASMKKRSESNDV